MKSVKSVIKGSLRGKVLRMIGLNRDFEFSPHDEGANVDSLINHKYLANSREIRLAMVEIEENKAKALMEWQRRRLAFA
jgi:hypothetical protein